MSDSGSDSEYGESDTSIIIDNGSYMIKAGFSGDDAPRAVFPTSCKMKCTKDKDIYVGNKAQCERDTLFLRHPIQGGVIRDWDAVEKVWQHTFYNELRVESEEHKVLLTDSTVSKVDREKMTEIMFEAFQVYGLNISLQAALSLYASGRISGVVVDTGYDITNVVPIYQGNVIHHAIERIEIGGRHITECLMKILTENGLLSTSEYGIVNIMKEDLCYVSLDFEHDMRTMQDDPSLKKGYKLPNGKVINVGDAQFKAPEALFKPGILGKEFSGLHEATLSSVMKCGIEERAQLFSNILISGGNSMFKGLDKRIGNEVRNITSLGVRTKVIVPPERKYSVWLGGSICSSLTGTFNSKWISKVEYDEHGPAIIRRLSSIAPIN